jgi:hypothetical protein
MALPAEHGAAAIRVEDEDADLDQAPPVIFTRRANDAGPLRKSAL